MLELLRQRRSIREYTTEPIAPELLEKLHEAALRAPSGRGRNPWEFVFVTDKELLAALGKTRPNGSAFLSSAKLAIVVLGDEGADTWIEDCSIALTILHLTCFSLGLASCWSQVRLREHDGATSAEDYVRKLLSIPPNLRVEAILGVGHPARTLPGHPKEKLRPEKIKINRYAP